MGLFQWGYFGLGLFHTGAWIELRPNWQRLLTSVLRRAQTEPILSVILHVSVLETTFLVHNLHKTTSKSTLYIASQKRKFLKNDAAGVLTVCTEDHLIR